MMELSLQIKSIAASFLYGIFGSFLFNISYFILFTKYPIINIITNIFLVLLYFTLYFLILLIINDGIMHIYFLITLFLGFFIYNKIFVKLRVKSIKISRN